MEKLFTVIDETATLLQEELKCSYLEAVAETGENLFHGDVLQEEVNELLKKRLKKRTHPFGYMIGTMNIFVKRYN